MGRVHSSLSCPMTSGTGRRSAVLLRFRTVSVRTRVSRRQSGQGAFQVPDALAEGTGEGSRGRGCLWPAIAPPSRCIAARQEDWAAAGQVTSAAARPCPRGRPSSLPWAAAAGRGPLQTAPPPPPIPGGACHRRAAQGAPPRALSGGLQCAPRCGASVAHGDCPGVFHAVLVRCAERKTSGAALQLRRSSLAFPSCCFVVVGCGPPRDTHTHSLRVR